MSMFKKLIGSKQFYKNVLTLMIPIMIQNGITNFVNMLDNVMVGRIGTVEMNGVAVANQLIFVFNLCIFGAVSGAGIFSAQYHGSGDHKGVRDTFRFKVVSCLLLTLLGIGVFLLFGNTLSSLYLRGEGDPAEAAAALELLPSAKVAQLAIPGCAIRYLSAAEAREQVENTANIDLTQFGGELPADDFYYGAQ